MANSFSITIRAVDQATATVRKINNEISKSVRPVTMLGKSVKSLGSELGLGKMAASIGKVAKTARGAAGEIAKIGAPVLALVGGGSLIGILALADAWGRLGFEVARTSETLGVSAGTLQSLRGAAQMAGVSASDLTGGLKSLGDTMEDALYGRNQQALAVLNKLGIVIHKTKDGAIDSTRGMLDLADAIAKIKSPQVQGLVARQFGVEAMLPLLRKGSAAIEEYQRKARGLGAVMTDDQIARAENFGVAMINLKMAGEGLRNTIGDRLIPAFQPLIEQLTKWVTLNREVIGEKVGKWAQQFADWVKSIDFDKLFSDIRDVVRSIGSFVDAIGGWKVAAVGVAAIMAGPLLLAITNIGLGLGGLALQTVPLAIKSLGLLAAAFGGPTTAAAGLLGGLTVLGSVGAAGAAGYGAGLGINFLLDKAGISLGASAYNNTHADSMGPKQTGTARDVVSFFEKQGWSHAQALGIAANLKAESGFSNDIVGDGGKAYGVAQWHANRQERFKHWAHKDIRQSTLEEQLGFVNYELTQGTEKGAGEALRKAQDERQAASVVSRLYERPAATEKEAAARADVATSMEHNIQITLHGLPKGTNATARKHDGADVPVRVATSMPGVAP